MDEVVCRLTLDMNQLDSRFDAARRQLEVDYNNSFLYRKELLSKRGRRCVNGRFKLCCAWRRYAGQMTALP